MYLNLLRMNHLGQSQLLSVVILGNVMLALLLGVMEYSQQVKLVAIRESKTTEMRKALDASHRMLLQLYREAVCDPVALNNKINYVNTVGRQTSVIGNRQVSFNVNGRDYLVSLGPVSRMPWALQNDPSIPPAGVGGGEDVVGVSQDATVEVWTSFGTNRVTQKAVLINDCSYPCAYEYGGVLNAKMGMCAIRADPIVGYNIADPSSAVYSPDTAAGQSKPAVNSLPQSYAAQSASPFIKTSAYWPGNVSQAIGALGTAVNTCTGENDEPTSNLTTAQFTGPARIDVRDLTVFRDYLRSGNLNATCTSRVNASDLNADGLVNENDLIILEKFLRGYLYQIPVIQNSSF